MKFSLDINHGYNEYRYYQVIDRARKEDVKDLKHLIPSSM